MLLRENICVTAWKFKYICILLWVNKTFIQGKQAGTQKQSITFSDAQNSNPDTHTRKKKKKQSSLDPENANICKQPLSFILAYDFFHLYIKVNDNLLSTATHASFISRVITQPFLKATAKTRISKQAKSCFFNNMTWRVFIFSSGPNCVAHFI